MASAQYNEDQQRILRGAAFQDVGAALRGDQGGYRSAAIKGFDAEEERATKAAEARRAEAGRILKKTAVGYKPTPEEEALLAETGMSMPSDMWGASVPPAAPTDAAPSNEATSPDTRLSPTGAPGGAPGAALTADQQRIVAGDGQSRMPPQVLRWLAANGVDTKGLAPEWEFQDAYDPTTGRQQRVAADKMDPTQIINVGGVKGADPVNLQAVEIGQGGGRVKGVFNPATGKIEGTMGDVMYPEPNQPSIGAVMAPIFQKLAQGQPLTPGEDAAMKQYRTIDPMNAYMSRVLNGDSPPGGPPGGTPAGRPPTFEEWKAGGAPSAPAAPSAAPKPAQAPSEPAGLPSGSTPMPPSEAGKRRWKTPAGRILEEK